MHKGGRKNFNILHLSLVACILECWNMQHLKSELCQQKFSYGCKQTVALPNWGIDIVSVDRQEDKGDQW